MSFEIAEIWEWLRANIEVAVATASAIVALLSALISRGETARQRRLQVMGLRNDIDKASLEWGCEAIEMMGEAAGLALARESLLREADFKIERLRIARRLSALVDRGRMFFPNIREDGHGAGKEVAYEGRRPPILDALMYGYYEVLALGENGVKGRDAAGFITECRRLLTSELQSHLAPGRLDEVIGRYDSQRKAERERALDRAAQLRLLLDVRRPDQVPMETDRGWSDRISPEARKQLLADHVQRAGRPSGTLQAGSADSNEETG